MQKSKFGRRSRRDDRKSSERMSWRNTGSEKYYKSGTYNTDPPRKVEHSFSISATSRQHRIRNVDPICLKNDQITRSEKRVRDMPFYENENGSKRRRISEKEILETSRYSQSMPRYRMRDGEEWRPRTHGDEGGRLTRRKQLVVRSIDPLYNEEADQRRSKKKLADKMFQKPYMKKKERAWGKSITLNNEREAYDYSRNRHKSPGERRFQINTDGTGNKKQQRQNEDRWIVEPRKNTRKENDELAAKVFTVLVDNGGTLKRKELESKLRAKPLTLWFVPSGALFYFLKDYRNIFEIINPLSEEQEEGEILDPIVNARSAIQICVKHASSTKSCTEHCNDLHVCKFHFISECSFENCKFGHDLDTEHNKKSLEFHHMQHLNNKQVKGLLTDFSHRRGVTIPSICSFYNYIQGCSKSKSECPHLHVCKFITDKCAFYPKCKRSHQLDDEQPKQVLRKHGIEVTPENKDIVIDLLRRGLNSKLQVQVKSQSENDAVHDNGGTDKDMQATDKRVSALQPQSELGKNLLRYWNIARLVGIESIYTQYIFTIKTIQIKCRKI